MAIFDFKCKQCETIKEVMQKSDAPAPLCSVCGGEMEKLITQSNFNFYFTNGAGTWSGGTFNKTKLMGKDI